MKPSPFSLFSVVLALFVVCFATPSAADTYCSAGTYLSSGRCEACAIGKFSAANATQCDNCPAGSTSSNSRTSCSVCSAGTYSASAGVACSSCAVATYSAANATSCTACDPTTVAPATGMAACITCPQNSKATLVDDIYICNDLSVSTWDVGTGWFWTLIAAGIVLFLLAVLIGFQVAMKCRKNNSNSGYTKILGLF